MYGYEIIDHYMEVRPRYVTSLPRFLKRLKKHVGLRSWWESLKVKLAIFTQRKYGVVAVWGHAFLKYAMGL